MCKNISSCSANHFTKKDLWINRVLIFFLTFFKRCNNDYKAKLYRYHINIITYYLDLGNVSRFGRRTWGSNSTID